MSIRVLRPGLFTTVQDAGRHGLQHLGLCPGGAMDDIALTLANALVGNAPGEAALEVTVIGPELQFERECLVAVCGAEFLGAFPHNRPVLVPAGGRYSVGRAVRGARAYVAVAGGLAFEPVLGSRSTYLPGSFGGLEGRALKHGDVLPLNEKSEELSRERFARLKAKSGASVRWSAPPLTLPDREPVLIHVIEGQHHTSFEPASQREFVDAVWRIAPESNRMGFRLQGPALQRMKGAGGGEILSGPTCLGSVQVPAGGAPIALMADHQTTGGYPRIAEVCSADVPRLAQLAPGGKVHFAHCSLETAAELRSHMQERLNTALRGIAWSYGS